MCGWRDPEGVLFLFLLQPHHLRINRPAGQGGLQRPIVAQVGYDFKKHPRGASTHQTPVWENPGQNGWGGGLQGAQDEGPCSQPLPLTAQVTPAPPKLAHTRQHSHCSSVHYFAEISQNVAFCDLLAKQDYILLCKSNSVAKF